jgi:autotransporter passenger strand-loop-strand repeat protein
VLSNGVATGTVIGSGAELDVFSGGIGSATSIGSFGNAYVLSDGTAIDTGVASGGSIFVLSGGTATGTVVASGGYEVLSGGTATDTTLSAGGSIELATYIFASGGSGGFFDPAVPDLLTVSVGGQSYTQLLSGDYTGAFVHLSAGIGQFGGTVVTIDDTPPCYCLGTRVLTDGGEIAVEDLRIGDKLMTVGGQARPLRWIGRRSYAARFAARNRDIRPVLIRAGALDAGVPARDLQVSPKHAMYLDGVLVPAECLVNGSSIVQPGASGPVHYFHLELETHDVILAEGAPSETFVDDDSRMAFHNALEFTALYPNASPGPAIYCARRVDEGYELEAIRRRLRPARSA